MENGPYLKKVLESRSYYNSDGRQLPASLNMPDMMENSMSSYVQLS